jgi:hypothetical protein
LTHKKRIYLVTNAHRKTLELKMRVTNLASYFDGIISSHDYDVAKEKQELLGLLMATTVPMPYCLADFKTEGESSKKMLFALSNLTQNH